LKGLVSLLKMPIVLWQRLWYAVLSIHLPIAYKLAEIFTIIITCGMVTLGVVIGRDQTDMLERQMIDSSTTVVRLFGQIAAEPLLADDNLTLTGVVNNLVEQNELLDAAAIYTVDLKPIVNAGPLPGEATIGANAGHESMFHYNATSETEDSSKILVGLLNPMQVEGTIVGYAFIGLDRTKLEAAKEQTLETVAIATMLLVLMGFIASIVLGKRLSRPIHQLVNASRAIAAGDYQVRFNGRRSDELGQLMTAMNEMSEKLLEKERVEQTFSRYVAPKVAKELLGNSDLADLGGRNVNASVLFADIVGFTTLSEKMPPDKVSELLNEYFGYIAEIVHMYHGHIDKYIGDCVMAVFGAPGQDDLHAQHAVECAVLIQDMVAVLNEKRKSLGLTELMFHIGVNSGSMLAGNIGSSERMDYTVMGRAVNIASRLSGAALPGGVLISDTTYEAIQKNGHIQCQPAGVVTLRGSAQPLATFVVEDIIGLRRHLVKSRLYEILKYSEEAV